MQKRKIPGKGVTWGQELKSRQGKARSLIKIAQHIAELSAKHNLSIDEYFTVLEIAKEYPFKHTLTFEAPMGPYDINTAMSISNSIALAKETYHIP